MNKSTLVRVTTSTVSPLDLSGIPRASFFKKVAGLKAPVPQLFSDNQSTAPNRRETLRT